MMEGKDSHLPQNDILRVQIHDDNDFDYVPPTLLSTDKKKILDNTNRPLYVRSSSGGIMVRVIHYYINCYIYYFF